MYLVIQVGCAANACFQGSPRGFNGLQSCVPDLDASDRTLIDGEPMFALEDDIGTWYTRHQACNQRIHCRLFID